MWIHEPTALMSYLSYNQYGVLYDTSTSYIFNMILAVRLQLSLFRRSSRSKKKKNTLCVDCVRLPLRDLLSANKPLGGF